MSIPEVVAAGKKAGLTFSRALVHIVRAKMTGTKTAKQAAPKKPVATKTPASKGPKVATSKTPASKQTPATLSKADFVRQHPTLSAKDVVEKAKAEGISLDTNHVYTVRTYDKKAKTKKRAAKKLASKSAITTVVVEPGHRGEDLRGSEARGRPDARATLRCRRRPHRRPAPCSRVSLGLRPGAGGHPGRAGEVEGSVGGLMIGLGVERAVEILAGERARVRAVMGG